MSDMHCPYCNAENEVCHDDGAGYAEDQLHEHTCYQCEKNFVFKTSVSFYSDPYKADCLNGSEHRLEMSITTPKRYSKMRCKDCDYQRKPTEQEFEESKNLLKELL
jgi:hypothetical protein